VHKAFSLYFSFFLFFFFIGSGLEDSDKLINVEIFLGTFNSKESVGTRTKATVSVKFVRRIIPATKRIWSIRGLPSPSGVISIRRLERERQIWITQTNAYLNHEI